MADIQEVKKEKRIITITEEQKAKMPEWRQKWIDISMDTRPADREKAVAGIRMSYECAGHKWPGDDCVLWVDSIVVGGIVSPLIQHFLNKDEKLTVQEAFEKVKPIFTNLKHPMIKEYNEVISQGWSHYRGGNLWCAFPARASFVRVVLGLDDPEYVKNCIALEESHKHCGYWWPHNMFVVITERLKKISLDDQGRLHCDNGPAIQWRDNFGIYYYHNMRVPRDIINDRSSITLERISKESNAELRRAMMELYGTERYFNDIIKKGGAKLLHEDNDQYGRPRALYELPPMPQENEKYVVIKLTNSTPEPDGTFKIYIQRCHPELRPLLRTTNNLGETRNRNAMLGEPQKMTCHNAVASLFGMRGEDYNPQIET